MKAEYRKGKPSPFQVKTIRELGGTMKGIMTYRDAENYIKRLRAKINSMLKGVKKKPQQQKKSAQKPTPAPKKATVVKKPVPAAQMKQQAIKDKKCACNCEKRRQALAKKDAADKNLPVIKNGHDVQSVKLGIRAATPEEMRVIREDLKRLNSLTDIHRQIHSLFESLLNFL